MDASIWRSTADACWIDSAPYAPRSSPMLSLTCCRPSNSSRRKASGAVVPLSGAIRRPRQHCKQCVGLERPNNQIKTYWRRRSLNTLRLRRGWERPRRKSRSLVRTCFTARFYHQHVRTCLSLRRPTLSGPQRGMRCEGRTEEEKDCHGRLGLFPERITSL